MKQIAFKVPEGMDALQCGAVIFDALAFAIKAIDTLPEAQRPVSKREDFEAIFLANISEEQLGRLMLLAGDVLPRAEGAP